MSKFVVVDGDTVNFDGAFAPATFVPPTPAPSTTIKGTGTKLQSGAKVCISGDEKKVKLSNVNYLSGAFAGGNGTLTIDSLAGDQLAQKLTVGGTAAILVGTKFTATFTVDSAGKDPSSGTSDLTKTYSGTGTFSTANTKLDSA